MEVIRKRMVGRVLIEIRYRLIYEKKGADLSFDGVFLCKYDIIYMPRMERDNEVNL